MVWINSVSSWYFCAAEMTSFSSSPTQKALNVTVCAVAYVPHVQTVRSCPRSSPTDIFWLCSSWKIPLSFRISCSHLLGKMSPLLSFLIPQISHYRHPCFFGQAGLRFDAGLVLEVMLMEGIQPALLHHSTPALQDAVGVPRSRSGNNFCFLLLFFITFQWNTSPALFHNMIVQRAGAGTAEEWCSIAWGQKRWNWVLGCFWGHKIRKLWPLCYWPEVSLPSVSSK